MNTREDFIHWKRHVNNRCSFSKFQPLPAIKSRQDSSSQFNSIDSDKQRNVKVTLFMADAKGTRLAYMKTIDEEKGEINKELLHILSRLEDGYDSGDSIENDLHLNGNKRNDSNELYRNKIDDEEIRIIYLVLKSNTFITGLDLGYNSIGDGGGCVVGKLLQETCVLKTLILSYNDIGAVGCTEIAKGIQLNETLRVLRLDGNRCGVYGGLAMAGAIQVNTTLEVLDMCNTHQEAQSIIAFCTVLRGNSCLKKLDIGRTLSNSQQEETAIHIGRMLEVNIQLSEIHLSKHSMSNVGVEQLMQHLISNIALVHLDLSCNSISRDGILRIGKYLKSNPPLQVLNLAYNRTENSGAVYLSDALSAGNNSLVTLVLSYNSIKSDGLCALAKALEYNTTLKQLFVWGNEFDAATSKAFLNLTGGDYPRLNAGDTDVRAYVVDDIPYLAKVHNPIYGLALV